MTADWTRERYYGARQQARLAAFYLRGGSLTADAAAKMTAHSVETMARIEEARRAGQ